MPKRVSWIFLSKKRWLKLHFKKVGKFWSVRVGSHHRALAVEDAAACRIWVWIGTHNAYDRLI
jgi:hypothetical protein